MEAELLQHERQSAEANRTLGALEESQRSLATELQRINQTKTMRWSRPLRHAYRRIARPGPR